MTATAALCCSIVITGVLVTVIALVAAMLTDGPATPDPHRPDGEWNDWGYGDGDEVA